MQWELIVALVLAIPVILFPVAFVWYVNIGGIVHAAREKKVAREKKLATAKVAKQRKASKDLRKGGIETDIVRTKR